MQIFTLGKNGITLFYFAFILFSGTYSYGQQACDGVTDQNDAAAGNQQYFCDSQEAEINNLHVDGDDVTFYTNADYDEPLTSTTTLLTGGSIYYVEVDGCQTTIEVTIFNEPQILGVEEDALTRKPEANTKQSLGTVGICVADVNDPNIFVSDLRTNAPAGTIQWYRSATATGELQPIPASEELENNTYYYAERVYNDPVDAELNCTTNRARTLVVLSAEEAPVADDEQEFCASEAPTVGDIVATGNNRYYTSATSQVEISQNEPLEDGRTYFVSTLGQTCESELRSPVTVTLLEADAGEQVGDGIYCLSEIQDRLTQGASARQLFTELLEPGVPTNGTFSDDSIPEIEAAFNNDPIQTFTTTYTITTEEGCEDSVDLSITVTEDSNAGDDADLVFCQSEIEGLIAEYFADPENLQDPEAFFAEWIGDRDTNGTFTGEPLQSILTQYSEGDWPIEVSTTYTVGEETECEDSANISLTINEGVDLADSYEGQICNASLDESIDDIGQVRALFLDLLEENAPQDGTFSPNLTQIINQYENDPIGPFTTTYTVGEGECQDSAQLTLTVNQDVNAGQDATITLNPDDEPVNLFDELGDNPDEGGTWSTGNGIFDPSTDSAGSFVYTVSNGGCEDSATIIVTIGDDDSDGDDGDGDDGDGDDGDGDDGDGDDGDGDDGDGDDGDGDDGDGDDGDGDDGDGDDGDGDDADCPEVTNPDQSFCPGEATVADLFPTNVSWYATATTTEVLSPDTLLEDGEDYFAGNTEGTCESRSAVTVSLDGQIAGSDNSDVICNAGLDESIDDIGQVRTLFLNLLNPGVSRNGTFSPSLTSIINQYENNPIDDFTTTYTVVEGDCEDSAVLTLSVIEPTEAEVADIEGFAVCSNEEALNLFDYLDLDPETGAFSNEDGTIVNGNLNISTPGVSTITYTVNEENAFCVTGSDFTTFDVEVLESPDLGEDVALEYCITEIEELTEAEALAIFSSLVPEDVDQDGEFSTPIETLIAQFLADPIGTFETTYTVAEGECEGSIELSITINDETEAEAGDFDDLTFCTTDEDQDLYELLSAEAISGGIFSIDGEELENGTFSPSAFGVDTFTITYTVDESVDCVEGEDSASFDITVVEGEFAGNNNSEEICNAEIEEMLPNVSNVRNLFLDLLDEGVSREGTFNPSIQSLADRYNSGDEIGTFTTTYTVSNGVCEDSVELSVIVIDSTEPGQDLAFAFCSTEGPQNLYDLLAEEGLSTEGSFDDLEDGIFNPSENEAGEYDFEYTTASTGVCEATVHTITVTVEEAEAPEVTDQTFCVSQEVTVADLQTNGDNLQWYTDEDLTTVAEETDALVEGSYYATQTTENGCVSEATEITVTLEEAPEAPAVTSATFCVVEGATVADLNAEGENIQWYSDAALSAPLDETTVLTTGDYYATQTTAGGCESEAATLSVTLEDAPAPTLVSGGNEFCGFENPTIAELENNIVEDGTITWYSAAEGGETYSSSELLVQGTTYYASLTVGADACESSARLAVTVDLDNCPIVIPEAFSPNGDGINDTFEIEYIADEYPNFRIEIYNRWGDQVFEGNATNPNWNGVSNEGSLGDGVVPVGVYFYILDYNDGQTSPSQGRLYLSR